jgi:hypothetical protein
MARRRAKRRRRRNPDAFGNPTPSAVKMAALLGGFGALAGATAFALFDRRASVGAAIGAAFGVGLVAMGEAEDLLRGNL